MKTDDFSDLVERYRKRQFSRSVDAGFSSGDLSTIAKGLPTYRETAVAFGVSEIHLRKLRNGSRIASRGMMARLADAMGLSVQEVRLAMLKSSDAWEAKE